jgi:uncharacterized protein (DUF4415 family)
VDATPGVPDDEIPEITQDMMDRGTLRIAGVVVRGPRKRGRPLGSGNKESVHIMLDRNVVAHYRATGTGWQTRINATLSSIVSRATFAVPGIGKYSFGGKSPRLKRGKRTVVVRCKGLPAKKSKTTRSVGA